jgi:hypothetical protein
MDGSGYVEWLLYFFNARRVMSQFIFCPRTIVFVSIFAFCLFSLSGCGTTLTDPKSNVPELAGTWKVSTNYTSEGYITMDSNGDPIQVMDNPDATKFFKDSILLIDGQLHSTSSGFQYSAIGSTTKTGSILTFNIQVMAYMAGVQVGTVELELLNGSFSSPNKIQGDIQITQNIPGFPSSFTKAGSAVRVQ